MSVGESQIVQRCLSIIEIDEVDGEKTFEVLATNGDTHLGGEDFDSRLINYLVEEFKKDQGIDLRNDPLAMQRLKDWSFPVDSGKIRPHGDQIKLHEKHAV